MSKYESQGFWYDVTDPEDKIPGTLTITNDGKARLRLLGGFGEADPIITRPSIPLAHGIAEKELVTVAGLRSVGTSVAAPGLITNTYAVETVIHKHHCLTADDLKFDRISCQMTYLRDWSGITGLGLRMSQKQDGSLLEYSQSYKHPSETSGEFSGISFAIGSGLKTDVDRKSQIRSMEEHHQIRFSSADRLTLQEWSNRAIRPFMRLLSLAVSKSVAVTLLNVMLPDPNDPDNPKRYPHRAFFDGMGYASDESSLLFPTEMVFTLAEVADSLSDMLRKFGSFAEDFKPLASLFDAIAPGVNMTDDTRFFSIVRSLESFHRESVGAHSHDSHKAEELGNFLIGCIPNQTTSDLRELFTSRLQQPLETELRKRLNHLLGTFPAIVSALLPQDIKKKRFIEKTIQTRNCFAHGSAESCKRASTGKDLLYLGFVWSAIGEAVLLEQMGVSKDRVIQLFESKDWFRTIQEFRDQTSFG